MQPLPELTENGNHSAPVPYRNGTGGSRTVSGSPVEGRAELVRYLRLLKRRGLLVLLITIASALAATVIAIRSPRVYSANSTILVSSKQQERVSLVSEDQNTSTEMATAVNMIKTSSVLQYAVHILKGQGYPLSPGAVAGSMTVINIPGTNLINIRAEGGSPKATSAIAEAAALGFAEYRKQEASYGDIETVRFLNTEVRDARNNLAAAEAKVQSFEERTRLGGPSGSSGSGSDSDAHSGVTSQAADQLASLQGALETALADRAVAARRVADIQSKLGQQRAVLATDNPGAVRDNNLVRQLQQQLNDKQTELTAALAEYTPEGVEKNYPGLREAVESLKKRLHDATIGLSRGGAVNLDDQQALEAQLFPAQAELHGLDTRIASLQQQVAPRREAVLAAPSLETNLNRLVRDRSVMEQIYRNLLERQKQAEISVAAAQGDVTVVQDAETPRTPIRPERTKMLIMGVLFGLALGCSLVMFLDYLDNSIRSQADVTETIGLPLLGAVPMASITPVQVWEGTSRSLAAEAYRMLRSNIKFLGVDSPVKTILITSAAPGEGKSSTIANIAGSMAQEGKRVVVVDADMRKPNVHRLLGGGRNTGLAEVLSGAATFPEAVRESLIAGVWTLPVGKIPPNPTELLSSHRMRDLLDYLAETFDVVLIDSPPCLLVADAVVLTSMVDATIQVIYAGKTPRDAASRARQMLQNAHGRVVGAVLNRFNAKDDDGYGYAYYYNYYYEEDANSASRAKADATALEKRKK